MSRLAGLSPLLLLAPATPALADLGPDGQGWHGAHMMGWGGWIMGPLMMLIFFGLLVGAVVLIVRLLGNESGDAGQRVSNRPIEILRERFAKGEIDAEDFEARKKALES